MAPTQLAKNPVAEAPVNNEDPAVNYSPWFNCTVARSEAMPELVDNEDPAVNYSPWFNCTVA